MSHSIKGATPFQPTVVQDELENFIDTDYEPVEHIIDTQDEKIDLKAVFEEIADWKLEAKLEDNTRYFYHVGEVEQIEKGRRSFVIGRKGCGKTAISEYLCREGQTQALSVKLTFKNFPFNELYALKDTGYAGPHQYITLWKFLIYSHVCELMAENTAIEDGVRLALKKAYIDNKAPTLPRRINRWLEKEFGSDIFAPGQSTPLQSAPPTSRPQSLIDRVNELEDLILKSIDSKNYLIVFDELDEDYRNIIDKRQNEQYSSLITGLFKAVQDVRAVFSKKKFHLYPIVFLRDDIYELIQDSDKTKWNDLKIALDWDVDRIKQLIAFRISRALNATGEPLPFEKAWHILFFKSQVRLGTSGRNAIHSFDYIARSTQLRPRDFIQYLKACSEEQMGRKDVGLIGSRVIKKVDNSFSNYLKSELIDEIHAVLQDIGAIFDVMSQLRKWSFSIKEFIDAYNRQLKRAQLKERDPTFVLQILFLFSVVGNHPRDRQIFRYKNREARFNFDEQVVVHRGLFKALQIGVN